MKRILLQLPLLLGLVACGGEPHPQPTTTAPASAPATFSPATAAACNQEAERFAAVVSPKLAVVQRMRSGCAVVEVRSSEFAIVRLEVDERLKAPQLYVQFLPDGGSIAGCYILAKSMLVDLHDMTRSTTDSEYEAFKKGVCEAPPQSK